VYNFISITFLRALASKYALVEKFQFLIGRKMVGLRGVIRAGQATCCGLDSSSLG
jgi:hypothetical protein